MKRLILYLFTLYHHDVDLLFKFQKFLQTIITVKTGNGVFFISLIEFFFLHFFFSNFVKLYSRP